MTSLVFVLVLFASQKDAATTRWEGRLAIGAEVYAVAGASLASLDGSLHFSLQISASGSVVVRTISATLTPSSGEVNVDGQQYSLPVSTISAWRRQLQGRLEPDLSSAEYICRTSGTERVCDSRTLVVLDESLSGRLRLIYTGRQLSGIRFFSLAEWNNPFREYLSLSLQIE